MAKYFLTNKAVEDLERIWNYTFEKWSEEQADKYYQMLINTCESIAVDPDLGKSYEGVARNLLGLKTVRHIIFYRDSTHGPVEIIRILHERMDLKNRLTE